MKVITVGRSVSNDKVIPDPLVSRTHVRIVQDDHGNVTITDLNSKNGTTVNGMRIPSQLPQVLREMDILKIGNTVLPWSIWLQEQGPVKPAAEIDQHAGFLLRLAAYFIDYAILTILQSGFLVVMWLYFFANKASSAYNNIFFNDFDDLFTPRGSVFPSIGFVIFLSIIGYIVIAWVYYAAMESSNSQATIGKQALRIKVTDMAGERLTFTRATGRYFAKIISGLTLGVGYMLAGWTQKKQALHDLIADTLVVRY